MQRVASRTPKRLPATAWRIEVRNRRGFRDAAAEGLLKDVRDLDVSGLKRAEVCRVYLLHGTVGAERVRRIAEELLADPVSETWRLGTVGVRPGVHVIEVAYNPGVMDPVEESTLKGISDLGIEGVESVRTAKRYVLEGALSKRDAAVIAERLLVNPTVQHQVREPLFSVPEPPEYRFSLRTVPLCGARSAELQRISHDGQLFLNLAEMVAIQQHFQALGRDPTDVELESLAQTWSEHCVHKTFRGPVQFRGRRIENLLRETVMRATREINAPWCLSVFEDNAGIIEFDQSRAVCFKVETHNHPSALEPYGGAETGIGGVIRDILGAGLGARPILNTDIFCFAPPDYPAARVPRGILHPRRIMKGVVAGVRDYGNRMGIPTANGAVCFDERFLGNPLVFCGTLGIMPRNKVRKEVAANDMIVLVGGRTGRDGIHGATFSSGELTAASGGVSGGAVQIGNAITEKKLLDVLLAARDQGLYRAVTDCGGGGLSSSVGELGRDVGARVDLEKVPLKYRGLTYDEIWISEAQERMILAVPPGRVGKLLDLFRSEGTEATVIGRFTGDKKLQLFYEGHRVADLEMEFLHRGFPRLAKKAVWRQKDGPDPRFPEPRSLTCALLRILSCWNVCSKEWVIRQYDHEVQAATALKPLVGVNNDAPGDACILKPCPGSYRGIVVANGVNPQYGLLDPYWMAASCIDEAIRQIIAVGASPDRIALMDNFCGGNPDKPDRLGALVLAAQACYDMAVGFGTPFISGKDSLNNEFVVRGKTISIPTTLLISSVGIIPDIRKAISSDLKRPGNLLYVVGVTHRELGGSQYFVARRAQGGRVPRVNAERACELYRSLSRAMNRGLVAACHDCSEGGLGVALAEMCFGGACGAYVDLREVPRARGLRRSDFVLFSESNSRFVVEVQPQAQEKFEKALEGQPFGLCGKVVELRQLRIRGLQGNIVLEASVDELKEAWQKPLRW
jgi:phosphoribosylformylglycinamidine synthase